jgi:hypothetical protein
MWMREREGDREGERERGREREIEDSTHRLKNNLCAVQLPEVGGVCV